MYSVGMSNWRIKRSRNEICENLIENKCAIVLSRNGGYHASSKHMDTYFYFIRDYEERVMISLIFLKTDDQLSNIFT